MAVQHKKPVPVVDIIIRMDDGVVLIKRNKNPLGWALPGGKIRYGETAEQAANREAVSETSLFVDDIQQFGVYSDPERDPRKHTISVVFTARANGEQFPVGDKDAEDVGIFTEDMLPSPIVFDHEEILQDYFESMRESCEDKE
jgi:ADP-ribose pyrophosphatase YjhB (NUDIX family)